MIPDRKNVLRFTGWLILASLLFFIGWLAFSQLAFSDNSWPLSWEKSVKLYPGEKIIQKFTARRDNLSQIKIRFAENRTEQERTLRLEVLDEECSELLRESALPARDLSEEKPLPFRFDPIPDSNDRALCLTLTLESLEPDRSVKVYLVEDPHPDATNYEKIPPREDSEKFRSLAMRPGYLNASVWQDLEEINMRLSQYKPWFLKHYFLWTIILFAIILSVLTVIGLLLL